MRVVSGIKIQLVPKWNKFKLKAIILYQPDSSISFEVRVENESVWLNRNQIATLFDRNVKTIGKRINNELPEELQGLPTVAKFATVQKVICKFCILPIEVYLS